MNTCEVVQVFCEIMNGTMEKNRDRTYALNEPREASGDTAHCQCEFVPTDGWGGQKGEVNTIVADPTMLWIWSGIDIHGIPVKKGSGTVFQMYHKDDKTGEEHPGHRFGITFQSEKGQQELNCGLPGHSSCCQCRFHACSDGAGGDDQIGRRQPITSKQEIRQPHRDY